MRQRKSWNRRREPQQRQGSIGPQWLKAPVQPPVPSRAHLDRHDALQFVPRIMNLAVEVTQRRRNCLTYDLKQYDSEAQRESYLPWVDQEPAHLRRDFTH